MHGQTQNNNESINGVIWKRLPRKIPLLVETLLKCLYHLLLLVFNSGKRGLFDVYHGLQFGKLVHLQNSFYVGRINNHLQRIKKRRKTLRSIAKGYTDNETEEET